MMEGRIEISGMEIFARHGLFDEEQKLGRWFTVDVILELDVKRAAQSDHIEHTVNYQEIGELVHREMKTPSRLLESVTHRIIQAIKRQFPQTFSVEVSITKNHPPLPGKTEKVKVTLRG